VQEPVAKLQVTLQDRPIDIELAKYKRMFESACCALGAIGDALGCDPEEGGAEPILDAIAELKATPPAPAPVPLTEPELRAVLKKTNRMITNAMCGPFWPELEQACRAIEAAHGITGKGQP
jgi:hypothetical protein